MLFGVSRWGHFFTSAISITKVYIYIYIYISSSLLFCACFTYLRIVRDKVVEKGGPSQCTSTDLCGEYRKGIRQLYVLCCDVCSDIACLSISTDVLKLPFALDDTCDGGLATSLQCPPDRPRPAYTHAYLSA